MEVEQARKIRIDGTERSHKTPEGVPMGLKSVKQANANGCLGIHSEVEWLGLKRDVKMEKECKNPDAQVHVVRGNEFYNSKQYKKAIEEFNKIIELEPDYYPAYYYRGRSYFNLKNLEQYKKSIEDFSKAIELEPNYYPAYYYRGLAYKKIGEPEKANEDFNKKEEIRRSAAEEPRATNKDWRNEEFLGKDAWDWNWAWLIPLGFLGFFLFTLLLDFLGPSLIILVLIFVIGGGASTFAGICSLICHILKVNISTTSNQAIIDQLLEKDALNWHWIWLTPLGLLVLYLYSTPIFYEIFGTIVGGALSFFVGTIGLAIMFMSLLSFIHHIKKNKL